MYEKNPWLSLREDIDEILAEISETYRDVGVIKPAFWHVAAVLVKTAEYQILWHRWGKLNVSFRFVSAAIV